MTTDATKQASPTATKRRSMVNATARALLDWEGGDSPNRAVITRARVLIAAQQAHEREQRTLRIQRALEAKRERQGEDWHAGTRPYGWRSVGHGVLEPVPVEQQVIVWLLRQREAGYGWRSITDELNRAGTPSPSGGRWHMTTVRRVVNRGRDWRPAAGVDA